MRIEKLEAGTLVIPFKVAFKHSAAERKATQTFWVRAQRGSCAGIGEGCPREYVTAENLDSARTFFVAHHDEWLADICDPAALHRWVDAHPQEIDLHPAAWCAVELSMLDLFARLQGTSVENLLGLPALQGVFVYSAVLGDGPSEQFAAQLETYRRVGFSSYKIKLSGVLECDREKISMLHRAGLPPAAVRADANNLWSEADAAIDYFDQLGYPFSAVEEPIAAGDYAGMRRIASSLGMRIILDESLTRADQVDALFDARFWILNLRVSKLGGLLRSLRLLESARKRNLNVIVGAHVGETSLLTRAALTLAREAGGMLLAQEGAFGTHLLERDAVSPTLVFGAQGRLQIGARDFDKPGWGLAPT